MIKLYPHQREVLKYLRNGSILWGGTGSGKSITALVYFCEKVCDDMRKPRSLLIITTARKRDTQEWDGECAKLNLSRDSALNPSGIQVVIDSWNNIHKHEGTKGWFVIFDEQRVTGSGPWVEAFLRLARNNQWILLTATPGDKWIEYLPVFLAHGFYRNKSEFKRAHVVYSPFITRYPKIIGYRNEDVLEAHRKEILIGMHYEKKTAQHEKVIKVGFDRSVYAMIIRERFDPWKQEPIRDAAGLCYALRKVVNLNNEKMEKVVEIMQTHPTAIIFYNFDYELDMLRKLPMPIAEWNGHKHEPVPEGSHWAYLVQYAAGAEGWNCTSTDTTIFFSLNYSYKAMVQAKGRIDRINTGYHDLYYYTLATPSGIDMAIMNILGNKLDFNEAAYVAAMEDRA